MKTSTQAMLEAALMQTGVEFRRAPAEVAVRAAQSAADLAAASGQPGFAEMVQSEADRVWLFSAGRAVQLADAGDARAWGLLHGFLLAAAGA